MRKNIAKVIAAFKEGKSLDLHTRATCSTDGGVVYSYRLKIAEKRVYGLVWVINEAGLSRTTVSQVRAVRSSFGQNEIECEHPDCREAGAEMLLACAKARSKRVA